MSEIAVRDSDGILDQTESFWRELRGGRIFVTGGTGFLGSGLVESFVHANDRLKLNAKTVLLTRNPEAFLATFPHLASHPAIDLHRGDVRSFEFPKGEFSLVIHGANDARFDTTQGTGQMMQTITLGTRRLLDFCTAARSRKILYLSSGAIYGAQPDGLDRISEEYTGSPDEARDVRSAYGLGKRLAEALCLERQSAVLQVKIARGFAFVGPRLPLDGSFAAGNFIRDLLYRRPIQVAGNGKAVRSYLHTTDLAAWLWILLFRGPSGRAYNVGSDQPIAIRELAELVARNARPRLAVEINGDALTGESRYVPSIERAKLELGLRVRIPIEESIRRTIEWCQAVGSVA